MESNSSSRPKKPAFAGGMFCRMVVGAVGIVLGFSSCSTISVSKNLPPVSQDGKSLGMRVFQESNRVRGSKGLRQLPSNSALSEAAETHARFLVANVPLGKPMPKSIVHYDFAGRSTAVMRANSMNLTAEILVAMPPGQASPSAIVAAWMASAGHRGKLLGSWDLTGVGAAKAADGTWYVVQWFGNSVH